MGCIQNGASTELKRCLACGKTWEFRWFSLGTGCGLFQVRLKRHFFFLFSFFFFFSRKSLLVLCLLFLDTLHQGGRLLAERVVNGGLCAAKTLHGKDGSAVDFSTFYLEAVGFTISSQDKGLHSA